MANRKHYSEEFRLQAAKLVVQSGYTYKEAAKRLGAADWSIRSWVAKFRENGQLPPKGAAGPEADEFREMKKELKRLRMAKIRQPTRRGSLRIRNTLPTCVIPAALSPHA